MGVNTVRRDSFATVILDRPEVGNAVNGLTADALYRAFVDLVSDDAVLVSVPWGTAGTFGSGAEFLAIGTKQIIEPNGRCRADGSNAVGDVQAGRRCH